ncbi:uncharacterized protein SOCE26_010870 [Sorangium cellulosum]|uniref:Lipoprotein n=1 Tax=Sorangium cellulosum TaxID=56 RepID=A0A2L0EK81_SORCE|nr:hypothetical protein [Sorangium cellulosum]AUX39692.1 uncharacterized protein SOCE26_010870 [Sorangium cellulosum]
MNRRQLMPVAFLFPALLAGCSEPSGSTEEAPLERSESALQKGSNVKATLEDAGLPWRLTVSAELPNAPRELPVYAVVRGKPRTDMPALERAFGVRGAAKSSDRFGGVSHLRDGERHAYVYDHGGAAFHDAALIGSEEPMEPVPAHILWKDAARRLGQLKLLAAGPVQLEPGNVGSQTVTQRDERGEPLRQWISAQSVVYKQRIDGLPTFGAGSEVDFVYVKDRALASFSHAVREIEKGAPLPIDAPLKAIRRYLDRAAKEQRWNLLKAHIRQVDRVDIEDVQLGYYVPEATSPAETLEPVYALRGKAHGTDGSGAQTTVNVAWFEPAAAGRAISSLAVGDRPRQ